MNLPKELMEQHDVASIKDVLNRLCTKIVMTNKDVPVDLRKNSVKFLTDLGDFLEQQSNAIRALEHSLNGVIYDSDQDNNIKN